MNFEMKPYKTKLSWKKNDSGYFMSDHERELILKTRQVSKNWQNREGKLGPCEFNRIIKTLRVWTAFNIDSDLEIQNPILQLSSSIINCHQVSSIVIIYHQVSSIIINYPCI